MTKFNIALLCLLTITSYGQKCNEVVDPITSEKKVEFVKSDPSLHNYVKYELVKGKAYLYKPFFYKGAIKVNSTAGTEFIFKLKDGTILKLKTSNDVTPKILGDPELRTSYLLTFELSKEDLDKLATSEVTLIRFPKMSEEGFVDADKNDPHLVLSQKALLKGADCIKTSFK
jgi:hypothetical protein